MPGKLKAVGQALLLLALLGQWWFLESSSSDDEDFWRSGTNYSITRLAALQYLSMNLQKEDVEFLRRAAEEEYTALALLQLSLHPKGEAITGLAERLNFKRSKIKNLDTYNDFIVALTEEKRQIDSLVGPYLRELSQRKRMSWWVVLTLSVVGMGLVGIGEWRSEPGSPPESKERRKTRR